MKIEPFGKRVLISPVELKNHKTEAGLEIVQNDLCEGVVIELSKDLIGLLDVDDHILYPEGSGQQQYYKGKSCLWINIETEMWGKVIDDEYLNIDSL